MTLTLLALLALALAMIPCRCIFQNLTEYNPPPSRRSDEPEDRPAVSVLVPARNEEQQIRETLRSILASEDVDLEVIVLDDDSADRTGEFARQLAAADGRVRVVSAPPLPEGWCGKQHACHVLATLASHARWVFLDADVRLRRDALRRMVSFMETARVELASGIPRQETATFAEQLLIPLVHVILLGFLPLRRMRRSRSSALAAGCGQLVIVRADAYRAAGGHARIRGSLHDGLKLPRMFREAGFRTDLFDASAIASCRMYRSSAEVWRGLSKNAIEGLAAPRMIVPVTVLLVGGQVLPFLLLLAAPRLSPPALILTLLAAVLVYWPRMAIAARFDQPLVSVILHPLGVFALVVIQWCGLVRWLLGRPSSWRGRSYRPSPAPRSLGASPRANF
jgi:hypothetical protein